MRWCNVQTNKYDLQAKICPIICTHHILHNDNENKIPVFPECIYNKSSQILPNTPVCQNQWMLCYLPIPRLWVQSKSQWPDSSEMWTQYTMQSCEYTYQLSSWNLIKHLDNNTKVNRIKRLTIQVCTKFEEFILINEVMNAGGGHFYASLELLWQGIKSYSPWSTWVKWDPVTGDG